MSPALQIKCSDDKARGYAGHAAYHDYLQQVRDNQSSGILQTAEAPVVKPPVGFLAAHVISKHNARLAQKATSHSFLVLASSKNQCRIGGQWSAVRVHREVDTHS